MTGISNLGQALDQISRLKNQQLTMDNFSTQIASGKKTTQFSGLGTDILRSQRARADINKLDQYSTNITNAGRRIGLMTSAVKQIGAQANTLQSALTVSMQNGEGPDLETTQQLASDVYDFITDLLNSKDGERYLFAGADSSVKPLNDKNLYDTFLGSYVPDPDDALNPLENFGFIGSWADGTITTDEFIASYKGVSDSVMGYSGALSSGTAGNVSVRVDENTTFDYTMLANSKPIKDILIAIGVLKNLPPVENAPGAANDITENYVATGQTPPPTPSTEKQENFYKVFNDLAATIAKAVDQLEVEENRLSLVDAQTKNIKEQYTYQTSAYKSVIAEVEDIDLTETIVKMQQVQTSLEASFSVTALISNLSLVNFLR